MAITLTIDDNGGTEFNPNTNGTKISIYVCKGGTLNASANLHIGDKTGLYIEDGGTLNAPKLLFDNTGEFKNYGTVTINGSFSANNSTNTDIYNMGTLNAKTFDIEGGAKFFNQFGIVTIEGKSTVGCTDGVWRNDGTFHSGSMEFKAQSDSWYNHCRLEVDGDLNFTLGFGGNTYFILDAESYIGCENLHMSQAKIEMGYNSQIKVRNTATFAASSNNEIKCTGEKYSVIDMEKAVSEAMRGSV